MKSVISAAQAAARIPDGAVLMIGGFMGVGSPHRMIDALVQPRRGRDPRTGDHR
jgi:acetate CoA/acetoacetate CoA-transferase alpha subunit